jgi:hypothetical protein
MITLYPRGRMAGGAVEDRKGEDGTSGSEAQENRISNTEATVAANYERRQKWD